MKKILLLGVLGFVAVQGAFANVITVPASVTSFDVSSILSDVALVGAGMLAVAGVVFGLRKVIGVIK